MRGGPGRARAAMASPPLSAAGGSGGELSSGSEAAATGAALPGRDLSALFEQAAERLPSLLPAASKEQLLYLYARYKQVRRDRPAAERGPGAGGGRDRCGAQGDRAWSSAGATWLRGCGPQWGSNAEKESCVPDDDGSGRGGVSLRVEVDGLCWDRAPRNLGEEWLGSAPGDAGRQQLNVSPRRPRAS